MILLIIIFYFVTITLRLTLSQKEFSFVPPSNHLSSDHIRLDISRHHIALSNEEVKNIMMGKSIEKDFNGHHYYFFVYNPSIDITVSKTMLDTGGMWEKPLNLMFQSLYNEEIRNKTSFTTDRPLNQWINHNNFPIPLQVVDVGVNFGSFTLFAASQGAHVWGFDIQRTLLGIVQMGLRVNEYRHLVKLYELAAHDRNGLNFSFTPEKFNFGGTHIQAAGSAEFNVSSRRIEEIIKVNDIFFMKMDCEGCEPRALLGMDRFILERKVKHLAIEIQGDVSILEALYLNGYKCRIYDDKSDCKFPDISNACYMPTFESAKEMFIRRRPFEHWNLYMDVHCYLSDHISSLDQLIAERALEGYLVE